MSTKSLASIVFGTLSLALLASGPARAEQVINAHYEINVNDGGSKSSVRSTFHVKPGQSERLELNPNVVEFTVRPASDREYDLVVAVRRKDQAASAVRLSKKFRGTFGVPLELNADADAIELDGAISVVVLEDKPV
ncbi:MAG TPA: hypothetical protein VGN07_05785 [Steroidobacteraceae bacterium]